MPSTAPIGVLDSGMGGLSVLGTLRRHLPQETYIYYGDTANAPYGVRPAEDILRLSRAAAQQLVGHGVKALVIACNTATGVALEALEQELSIPVIGIQPALATAQALNKPGDILVMATPATLQTTRYARLKQQHGKQVVDLPCPGLMDFVEALELEGPRLEAHLSQLLQGVDTSRVETVVLGCTHYPFLAGPIGRHFPGAVLLDDSPRVAAALSQALGALGMLRTQGPGGVMLRSSGGQQAVEKMHQLLDITRQPIV